MTAPFVKFCGDLYRLDSITSIRLKTGRDTKYAPTEFAVEIGVEHKGLMGPMGTSICYDFKDIEAATAARDMLVACVFGPDPAVAENK